MPKSRYTLVEVFRNCAKTAMSLAEITAIRKKYINYIEDNTFGKFSSKTSTIDTIKLLKRDTTRVIGPYENISIFEAANRIGSDLVLINGVRDILKQKEFAGAKAKIRLGNLHVSGQGDFTIHLKNKKLLEGEAFNVSPSFFNVKLYKTLISTKLENLDFVIFNKEAIEDQNCNTYLETKKSQYINVRFVPITWDK